MPTSIAGGASTYQGQANCYAYAMGLDKDPRNGSDFARKPQPGEFSGNSITSI